YRHHKLSSYSVVLTIITLLRIWTDPQINLLILADCPIQELKKIKYGSIEDKHVAMLLAGRDRHIHLALQSRDKIIEKIGWIVEHWEDALDLRSSSSEFDFSLTTFD